MSETIVLNKNLILPENMKVMLFNYDELKIIKLNNLMYEVWGHNKSNNTDTLIDTIRENEYFFFKNMLTKNDNG